MSQQSEAFVRSIQDSMNLPRDNGEIIFHMPWEGRIFAMAVLMLEKGTYPWQSFNGSFVEEIGEAERSHPESDVASTYYRHWVKALEKVLIQQEIVTEEQLEPRCDEFETGQRHHVC
jgi:nitrile hydratase accessory protein